MCRIHDVLVVQRREDASNRGFADLTAKAVRFDTDSGHDLGSRLEFLDPVHAPMLDSRGQKSSRKYRT